MKLRGEWNIKHKAIPKKKNEIRQEKISVRTETQDKFQYHGLYYWKEWSQKKKINIIKKQKKLN